MAPEFAIPLSAATAAPCRASSSPAAALGASAALRHTGAMVDPHVGFTAQRSFHRTVPSNEDRRGPRDGSRRPLVSIPTRQMAYDPNIVYHSGSRLLERCVRLVCGGLFGVLPAFVAIFYFASFERHQVLEILAISIAVCAYLAQRHGDAFWHATVKVGRFALQVLATSR